MDSRVVEEWTTSEIEEARSLLASLNDNCNNNDDDGYEANMKHNDVVENIHKLFPWKTIQEVTGLYVELIVERRMMRSQEKSGGASNMHNIDPKSILVSDNFGISEEEAMLDAKDMFFYYPLEEMEIGLETQEAPVVEENKVEVGMETQKAPVVEENEVEAEMPVVVEKEVQVVKNRIDHRPVVPQKGMPWTTAEHSLFLEGLRVFGRGKWKSISKHLVTTKTPVQVSCHAQKYFQKMGRNAAAAERQRRSAVDEARNRWMKNPELAARAFAFAGVNYDPRLGLPSNPSLEDLAKIWAPLLYRPQASQAWGEQVMVAAAAPMEGAGSFVAAGYGASLPQPPPLLYRPETSQAWSEQVMVSAAAAPTEGAGSFAAAGHAPSLPRQWTGTMH